jgi:antitoxin ParD1/3/4
MANVEKISIALPSEVVARVRQAVEAGEYASSSEVVLDALYDWTRRRQPEVNDVTELKRIWEEAMKDDSPGIPAEEVMERLERKYGALAAAATGNSH